MGMASANKRPRHGDRSKSSTNKGDMNPKKPNTPTTKTHPKTKKRDTTDSTEEHTHENICNYIAELCESILEDPRAALVSTVDGDDDDDDEADKDEDLQQSGTVLAGKKRSQLRRLLDLGEHVDPNTCRLAMVSLLAVFQDILPTYRIRLPTAAEKAVRVSKETKQLWNYERQMLLHYQWYLKLLERTWEESKSQSGSNLSPSIVGMTALCSLCEMLKSALHFNFRSSILSLVVRNMSSPNGHVRETCCQTTIYVFSHDPQGEISLEASKLIARAVQNHRVGHTELLRTFLHLPLRVHEDEAEAVRIHTAAVQKKRKKMAALSADGEAAEAAEIEKELKEGSATIDVAVLAKAQADTLQTVVVSYFRILKRSSDATISHGEREKVRRLLPTALEGLAKFAHLIHLDTVVDLLALLKHLLNPPDEDDDHNTAASTELPLDAALNSLLTAFQTLQGPGGQTLPIDPKEYISPLYRQLLRLVTQSNAVHTPLALQAIDLAFLQRREYSKDRTAAFVKRMLGVSLHLPPRYAAPMVNLVRMILARYSSVQPLFESEMDVVYSSAVAGGLVLDAHDPERSNPFASSVWEVALLRQGVHPTLSQQAQRVANNTPIKLPFEKKYHDLRIAMERDYDEMYIRYAPVKMKHPLADSTKAKDSKKRRRVQYRFIKSRHANKTDQELKRELLKL